MIFINNVTGVTRAILYPEIPEHVRSAFVDLAGDISDVLFAGTPAEKS